MDGGSSFIHETCLMSIATQKVVARMSRSVHGYCYPSVPECPPVPAYMLTRQTTDREVSMAPLFPEIIRPSLLLVLWLIRSCFYDLLEEYIFDQRFQWLFSGCLIIVISSSDSVENLSSRKATTFGCPCTRSTSALISNALASASTSSWLGAVTGLSQ